MSVVQSQSHRTSQRSNAGVYSLHELDKINRYRRTLNALEIESHIILIEPPAPPPSAQVLHPLIGDGTPVPTMIKVYFSSIC